MADRTLDARRGEARPPRVEAGDDGVVASSAGADVGRSAMGGTGDGEGSNGAGVAEDASGAVATTTVGAAGAVAAVVAWGGGGWTACGAAGGCATSAGAGGTAQGPTDPTGRRVIEAAEGAALPVTASGDPGRRSSAAAAAGRAVKTDVGALRDGDA